MAKDFAERNLACEIYAKQHHASNPEEQNIPARLEQARRVVMFEIGCLELIRLDTQRNDKEITLSGQPMMENGHRAEENHVSSTSSSWSRVKLLPAASTSARLVASSSVRPTTQFLPSLV